MWINILQVNITVSDFNDWKPVFANPGSIIDPVSHTPVIVVNVAEDIDGKLVIAYVQYFYS